MDILSFFTLEKESEVRKHEASSAWNQQMSNGIFQV